MPHTTTTTTHQRPAMAFTGYVQGNAQVRTTLNAHSGQEVPTVCMDILGEGPAEPIIHLEQQFADHATAQACARRYTKGSHVLLHMPVFGVRLNLRNAPHLERLPDLPPVATAPAAANAEPELFA